MLRIARSPPEIIQLFSSNAVLCIARNHHQNHTAFFFLPQYYASFWVLPEARHKIIQLFFFPQYWAGYCQSPLLPAQLLFFFSQQHASFWQLSEVPPKSLFFLPVPRIILGIFRGPLKRRQLSDFFAVRWSLSQGTLHPKLDPQPTPSSSFWVIDNFAQETETENGVNSGWRDGLLVLGISWRCCGLLKLKFHSEVVFVCFFGNYFHYGDSVSEWKGFGRGLSVRAVLSSGSVIFCDRLLSAYLKAFHIRGVSKGEWMGARGGTE